MSWLSDFLGGGKKLRLPTVKPAEEIEMDDFEYGIDAYLKQLAKKSGFEKTIMTGHKLPKLASSSYLGAV